MSSYAGFNAMSQGTIIFPSFHQNLSREIPQNFGVATSQSQKKKEKQKNKDNSTERAIGFYETMEVILSDFFFYGVKREVEFFETIENNENPGAPSAQLPVSGI
uniref:PheT_1 protein n=1 Tax=Fopius arisanus TaxID=64838 RepID=A0A0C9QIB4_9HYME